MLRRFFALTAGRSGFAQPHKGKKNQGDVSPRRGIFIVRGEWTEVFEPKSMEQQEKDEKFMRLALNEAQRAFDEKEVPIGAVVVAGDRVIGRGHNLVEMLGDATAHAEMQALTAAASTIGGKYLPECTLYVTVEPCVMCAGAIAWSQVGRVVYGASDPKRGYRRYSEQIFPPKTTVCPGVLADECEALMSSFFAALRR